ncbi:glycoside hydrolase family 95 protein [Arachidicoccus terrestris]|uniref:glycoside hydrolase family 95 protein n=1 Tax=Arachidicoccus terrestris TaxID=2875539 RepID=UPI001CC82F44|nr:glycoside hydrolase family 95 protein [Arachidicoccus terrestris]
MNKKNLYVLLLIMLCNVTGYAQQSTRMQLWYDHPSGEVWENALPLGNGRLGAMVYGNVDTERIALNEATLWSGSPNQNNNLKALSALPEIRKLIFEGQYKKAENLANEAIISKKSQGQMFEPVGDLKIAFDGGTAYNEYKRTLDLDSALSTTTYVQNDVQFKREVFTSFTDQVVVIHLTASRPGKLSFTSFFTSVEPQIDVKAYKEGLMIHGKSIDHEGVEGAVTFNSNVRFKVDGGDSYAADSSFVVKKANEVTIFVSIATNFNNYHDLSGNPEKRVAAYMDNAFAKTYSSLLKAHVAYYQKYFNRVHINLGTTAAAHLPTDQRLKSFATGNDPQLVALYYQFGRYLLISASQPGGQPATLQGLWNNKLFPPWDSKYTININTEMNYWPAEKANLSEMGQPLFAMIKDLSVMGAQTAKQMYGVRGWMAHHNTDIWRSTGAVDGAFWGLWSNGGGWLSRHLWEHYLYTGDKAFLEMNYPLMKGAALFYADVLVEDPVNHWLVLCPDMSPENAPKDHEGASITAGSTMSNQIVFDIFSQTIKAARLLNRDRKFIDTLENLRRRLPPMHIGQYGQLQEWLEDLDNPTDHHRHISHLYGLFPSNQISPYRTPRLFDAAKRTLIQRGDISTGWSMAWKINWWARMLDGNHAYMLIQNQLSPVGTNAGGGGSYNNLFDAHPPFQIDGNFGCVSGITEMLMQSQDGTVNLIPALPDRWTKGRISGLQAIGGFEIMDLKWKEGRVTEVVVKSTLGGNLRLRSPNNLKAEGDVRIRKAVGENPNPFYQNVGTPKPVISPKATDVVKSLKPTFECDIQTRKGGVYRLYGDSRP